MEILYKKVLAILFSSCTSQKKSEFQKEMRIHATLNKRK
jgi:hypothetical protein